MKIEAVEPAAVRPRVFETKLIKIGNSTGVIVPKEVLAMMGAELGDQVTFTHTPSGLNLTKYDPDFSHKVSVARDVMKRRRNALRELAK